MQNIASQILQYVQQAIAAIFRFVELIWTWSINQIVIVTQSPWQNWPLWKQILLVLIAGGVIWALFQVARQLWEVGERILAAFAGLLTVLVRTLPNIVLAGVIAFGGAWILNNVDLAAIQLPRLY